MKKTPLSWAKQAWNFIRTDVPGWIQAIAALIAIVVAVYGVVKIAPIIINIDAPTPSVITPPVITRIVQETVIVTAAPEPTTTQITVTEVVTRIVTVIVTAMPTLTYTPIPPTNRVLASAVPRTQVDINPTITPPQITAIPVAPPGGQATIGSLNSDGTISPSHKVTLYPKTLQDILGQYHGDPNKGIAEQTDSITGRAVFYNLSPGVYIVCFQHPSRGEFNVGEIDIVSSVNVTQVFYWPPSPNIYSKCQL